MSMLVVLINLSIKSCFHSYKRRKLLVNRLRKDLLNQIEVNVEKISASLLFNTMSKKEFLHDSDP